MFTPNLSILPGPQRQLWAELKGTPKAFVLYGETALALRLGHRQSEDFDFFSNQPFHPDSLRDSIPYLKHAEMTQFQDNPLTLSGLIAAAASSSGIARSRRFSSRRSFAFWMWAAKLACWSSAD